jgi:putative tricarboxylic transport membrane protein
MRAAFIVAILCVATGYTWIAFTDLYYLSSTGRLGPGFFPRFIGVGLIVLCLFSLWRDRGTPDDAEETSPHWRTAVTVGLLSAVFVALLDILGGLLSMIAFMGAALAYLNRGRTLQNALIALLLPVTVYLLFDVWLNAAIPTGILPLPL